MRDLELRGAGNLLGAEQHGHLDAVGYELYVKLLERAVLAERGEPVEEKAECIVNLAYDACLPEKYVKVAAQRMTLYKRIALIASEYDLLDMTDELLDRYGEPPQAAAILLKIALIRSIAERAGIVNIRQDGASVYFSAPAFDTGIWMRLAGELPGKLRMMPSANPTILYRIDKGPKGLEDLKKLFMRYDALAAEAGSHAANDKKGAETV